MKNYHPLPFFLITFLVTWSAWFYAAYLSICKKNEILEGSFMGIGLLGPFIAALFMVFTSKNRDLIQDFKNKLSNFQLIKLRFLPFIFFLMPFILILSILISLLFGQSSKQFEISSEFNIMRNQPFLNVLIPFLAPALEELGWSGYGIDSLKSKMNMLKSTLLFGVLWSVWHLPLFFIKGYYHYNLWEENYMYALNFFISVIPLTILTNWLYFKNDRSIIAASIFHIIVVISCEMFQITNFSKCIVTVVLAIFSSVIIILDKNFFLDKEKHNPTMLYKHT